MIISLPKRLVQKIKDNAQSYVLAEHVFSYKGFNFKVVKLATGYYAVAVQFADDLSFAPFSIEKTFKDVKEYISITIQLLGNI